MTMQKLPVTRRAVVQRLARLLAKEGRSLKAVQQRLPEGGRRWVYHVIDTRAGAVLSRHEDLHRLASELGALQAFECLEADG